MAVIAINATAAGSAGVNINGVINAFNPGFQPIPPNDNAGVFVPGVGANNYTQFGIQPPSGTNNALVADGAFNYSPMVNVLSGTLNSMTFGTNLEDSGTSVSYPESSFTGTSLALDAPAFTISNIGLSGSGAGNALHNTFFSLLSGSESLFNAYLFNNASNSINFTGSSGDDTITASISADTLNGNGGEDVLNGGDGGDTINGGAAYDQLLGGNGNDTLNGGASFDDLTGGAGNDTFVFSTASQANLDLVTDFSGVTAGGGDIINLRGISGLNSWGGSVSGGTNSAWYANSGGDTVIRGDTDGNGTANFEIYLDYPFATGLTGSTTASTGFDVLV